MDTRTSHRKLVVDLCEGKIKERKIEEGGTEGSKRGRKEQ